jgi:hypothetical protein
MPVFDCPFPTGIIFTRRNRRYEINTFGWHYQWSVKVVLFFPSAVLTTGYIRSRTSVRNRLSGKLSPNLASVADRFHDMTILNREGLQTCRAGCKGVGSYT